MRTLWQTSHWQKVLRVPWCGLHVPGFTNVLVFKNIGFSKGEELPQRL